MPGTAAVLRVLRKEKVHATFFVVGANVKEYPEVIKQMAADGHAIGNHSWNHPMFWHLKRSTINKQLGHTDALVKRLTGKRPTVVRAPFGQIDLDVRKVAKARGQALIQWDLDPMDWRDRKSKVVTKRVLGRVKRNSIILTHDIRPSTRHSYAAIVRGLKKRGYTLVTVPELLGSRAKPGAVYFHG